MGWFCGRVMFCELPGSLASFSIDSGAFSLMRANTNYRVVTLVESVTMGGHFYSIIDNLKRTMLAGVREHLWGDIVTKTTHFKFEGMIYRLGAFLEKVERTSKEEAHLIDDEEKERLSGE